MYSVRRPETSPAGAHSSGPGGVCKIGGGYFVVENEGRPTERESEHEHREHLLPVSNIR